MVFTEKDKRVIEKFKAAVLSVDETAEIILFGSRARGDYKEESDYDFLILTEKKADYKLKNEFLLHTHFIQLDEEVILQEIVTNKKEWEDILSPTYLYQNIKEEGYKIC